MAELWRTLTGQSQKSDHSGHSAHSRESAVSRNSVEKFHGNPLTNTSSTTDPLTGTLNHLTEKQEALLEAFKVRLEKQGWWTREGVNGKASHDDGTLLRYLRARKFDIEGAFGQFTDTEKWAKEERVEELYEHFDVDFYEKARTMYPQWTGHRDRRGIPLYVFVVKHLDSKNVGRYQKESEAYKKTLPNHKNSPTPAKLLPLFALYHNLLNFVLPMCSTLERPNPEVPVTNSTNIVDISHVGLGQFWNLKAHMQDASVLATAHYPETLDRIFIIGAPSFFPTVWGWVKRWFDPVTVSKIFILSKHEMKKTLSSFIDLKDFPKQYGGELDWNFGDPPHMDAAALETVEKDGHKGWVRGPCLWLEHERVIVGSEKGKLRRADKEIAEKKPVVYAADFTEEPVHPERRASLIAQKRKSQSLQTQKQRSMANGTAGTPNEETKAGVAAGAATAGTAASLAFSRSKEASTEPMVDKNVRAAPFEGSPVRVSPEPPQPAPPAITAEYLSEAELAGRNEPPTQTKGASASDTLAPAPAVGPVAAAAPSNEVIPSEPPVHQSPTDVSQPSATVPPGMTQPGPLSKHQASVQAAVASKMNGESISTIPEHAGANGHLAHPELTVVSDPAKGLVVETEKLPLSNGWAKPPLERFHTAAEF